LALRNVYKAKCCGNNDGKEWLTQMLDEWQNENRSPSEFLISLSRRAKEALLQIAIFEESFS
jgi:hypothetical protein